MFRFHLHSLIEKRSFSFLTETLYGSIVVSSLGTFSLASSTKLEWGLSSIPLACILGIILIILSHNGRSLPNCIDAELTSFHLAARILPMLAATVVAEIIIFGYSGGHPLSIFALGLFKAFAYFFTIQTVSSRDPSYTVQY